MKMDEAIIFDIGLFVAAWIAISYTPLLWLGVIIGIFAILLMLAIIDGIDQRKTFSY